MQLFLRRVVDLSACTVLPGLIDVHTQPTAVDHLVAQTPTSNPTTAIDAF